MKDTESKEVKSNLRTVPESHWKDLASRDLEVLGNRALAKMHSPEGVIIRYLNSDLLVNIEDRRVGLMRHDHWHDMDNPLLELITVVYLLNATADSPGGDLISVNELKDALFFQGAHDLPIVPLCSRFGNDIEGFKAAALRLGGEPVDYGDAAFRFYPFPKVPLYYLLWEGDEEFEANMSILFDRSIEQHLAADGILGTVNLVSSELLSYSD